SMAATTVACENVRSRAFHGVWVIGACCATSGATATAARRTVVMVLRVTAKSSSAAFELRESRLELGRIRYCGESRLERRNGERRVRQAQLAMGQCKMRRHERLVEVRGAAPRAQGTARVARAFARPSEEERRQGTLGVERQRGRQ